jgi:hypothetical protein
MRAMQLEPTVLMTMPYFGSGILACNEPSRWISHLFPHHPVNSSGDMSHAHVRYATIATAFACITDFTAVVYDLQRR